MTLPLKRDRTLQIQPRLPRDLHTVTRQFAAQLSTARTELPSPQRSLAESRRPIGRQCAGDRSGRRILRNAHGRGEEPYHVVAVPVARRGHDRAAVPDVDARQRRHIRLQRRYLLGAFDHQEIVALVLENLSLAEPERGKQRRRGVTWRSGPRRKIELEPIALARRPQLATARLESNRPCCVPPFREHRMAVLGGDL